MKRINQGLSLVMSLLLVVSSVNLSMIAKAANTDAGKITGFNQLEGGIASQTLPVGASIDDVVFPDSIKATVETVEQVEVRKAVEKQAEEDATTEDAVDDSELTDEVSETTEPEQIEENTAEDEIVADDSEPAVEELVTEESEEESVVETTEPEADENTEENESVNTGFIDILFPAMVVKAAELENTSPLAGAIEAAAEAVPSTEYETVTETRTVQSEVTIENVIWQEADGKSFDSSTPATYTFEPVFTTDYVVE